jgi:tRNA modification GTPase
VTTDTIFALSSGTPPAAIAVIRISGPRADAALEALAGRLPEPRRASVAELSADGETLDRALVLRFPGPNSATGDDLAELHLHGGRAVVSAVLEALGALDGLRPAEPGEFTRRAFENGRIDLTEAEGLADLLAAETESQRRAALAAAGGALSRKVERWRERLLALAARLEASLDFSDEGEVGEHWPQGWQAEREALQADLAQFLARPGVERLRDGIRVVIAGPPNAGKSSLLNCLVQREAAITSPVAGTTRDVVEVPVAIDGVPFVLMDTAGLRESRDEVEAIGVARAMDRVATADIVIWLGDGAPEDDNVIRVHPKSDLQPPKGSSVLAVSSVTGSGIERLGETLAAHAARLLPAEGEVAANRRQRSALVEARESLAEAGSSTDMLVAAEALRGARLALDAVTGRAGVEDMLDALFGRFCIGK